MVSVVLPYNSNKVKREENVPCSQFVPKQAVLAICVALGRTHPNTGS